MSSKNRLNRTRFYHQRPGWLWWLERGAFTKFYLRELTSLAVLYSAVTLILQLRAIGTGGATHQRFNEWLASPPALALHCLVLAALIYHAVTWLDLAPKALSLRLGKLKLSDRAIRTSQYLAWIATSALVLWLVGGL